MSSNAILYHMPSGFAGDVTRMQFSKIEAQMVDGSSAGAYAPTAYGVPVIMVAGLIRKVPSGYSGAIYGWLVRPYPYHGDVDANSGLGGGVPPTSGPCDILRSGYMAVKLTRGTAVRGAICYVRVTVDSAYAVGDIEDGSFSGGSGTDCIAAGVFMGPVDSLNSAAGITEVSFNNGPSGIGT